MSVQAAPEVAAHEAMADLLNAPSAREIVFGANTTTLTFAFSRAIGRKCNTREQVPDQYVQD